MKAAVILGGGAQSGLMRRELKDAELIVCADGGAAHCVAAGVRPGVVVGDMDSIDPKLLRSLEATGVEVVRADRHKDETDAELALVEALRRGATEITLLGALGGRLDHTMGNLMLLLRAARRGIKAVLKDESCEIFAATGETQIVGHTGQTVSVLPIGEGVSVRYVDGVEYGLGAPVELPLDKPVGVSNVMTADKAHITISGWAYIVLNTRDLL